MKNKTEPNHYPVKSEQDNPDTPKKPQLIDVIHCINCDGVFEYLISEDQFQCKSCRQVVNAENGIPLFTAPPEGMQPSEKLSRGPEVGTPWRKANWQFLSNQLSSLDTDALLLDVGAGRGDFVDAYTGFNHLALDVYPYPEVDIVCDLTQANPFSLGCFDAIVLMNVLEHVYDTRILISQLSKLLKPEGILILAIPFLVKLHQEPIDYVRFTHYSLERLASDHGLEVVVLEGYYDPVFFLEEGIGNIRNAVLPTVNGSKRYIARGIISSIQSLSNQLGKVLGGGISQSPADVRSKAPTGYQVVYRKL